MTKLEKKYPLQFSRARKMSAQELRRGIKFYKNGGGFTSSSYHAESYGLR